LIGVRLGTDKEEIGKVACSKCGGVGQFQSKNVKGMCVKCLGEGSLDWIENVVGKKGIVIAGQKRIVRPGVYVEGGIMGKIFNDEMAKNLSRAIDRDIIEGINQEAQEQKYIKERRKRKKVKV